MKELVNSILPKVVSIPEETNYWMIRTAGGAYFDTLINLNRVVIGYPQITKNDLIVKDINLDSLKLQITQKIYDNFHKRKNTLAASQLIRFTYEVKKGDYVFIPSRNSDSIMIGIVLDDVLYEESLYRYNEKNEIQNIRGYDKYRKVRWLKRIYKSQYNPNLYQLFFSHQAIVNAKDYKDLINNMMYQFYQAGEFYHLLLKVENQDKLTANSLYHTMSLLTDLTEAPENEDVPLYTKINLNSPGIIEFFSSDIYKVLILGIVAIFINGGELKYNNFLIKTNGLMSWIRKLRKDALIKKLLENKTDLLQIAEPKDVVKLLDLGEVDENNNEEKEH